MKDFINETMTIPAMKMAARSHYMKYHAALEDMSCGKLLGEHINSRAMAHKIRFNQIMDELKKIDPECPDIRL